MQIRELADITGEIEGLGDLLDRLEEVRVEDFDHRPEMRPFQDKLRDARRAPTAGERHDLLVDVARRGLALFGRPHGEAGSVPDMVDAQDLQLVAWELLIERPKRVLGEQTTLHPAFGDSRSDQR